MDNVLRSRLLETVSFQRVRIKIDIVYGADIVKIRIFYYIEDITLFPAIWRIVITHVAGKLAQVHLVILDSISFPISVFNCNVPGSGVREPA